MKENNETHMKKKTMNAKEKIWSELEGDQCCKIVFRHPVARKYNL